MSSFIFEIEVVFLVDCGKKTFIEELWLEFKFLNLMLFYCMQENWSQREHSWRGNWKSVGTCKRPWSWRSWWGCWNQNCNGAAVFTKVIIKTSVASLFVCSRIGHTFFLYCSFILHRFYNYSKTFISRCFGDHLKWREIWGTFLRALAIILHKIMENVKRGNVKPRVYCVYNYGSSNKRYVMFWQTRSCLL